MATPATAHALVERTDIHKSCKSLEIILNILNEYCEAVGAIVTLQKKLAKALREAAGLKATGEIACMCAHFILSKHHGLKECFSERFQR
jgi:hypothetical protein